MTPYCSKLYLCDWKIISESSKINLNISSHLSQIFTEARGNTGIPLHVPLHGSIVAGRIQRCSPRFPWCACTERSPPLDCKWATTDWVPAPLIKLYDPSDGRVKLEKVLYYIEPLLALKKQVTGLWVAMWQEHEGSHQLTANKKQRSSVQSSGRNWMLPALEKMRSRHAPGWASGETTALTPRLKPS